MHYAAGFIFTTGRLVLLTEGTNGRWQPPAAAAQWYEGPDSTARRACLTHFGVLPDAYDRLEAVRLENDVLLFVAIVAHVDQPFAPRRSTYRWFSQRETANANLNPIVQTLLGRTQLFF